MTLRVKTRALSVRRHRQILVAALLAVGTVALLVVTAPDIGLTWDEPAYIAAAESYVAWFGRLFADPQEAWSASAIDDHWRPNHEHPPLDKVWSGMIWSLARHLTDDLTAHRLGNMLLVGGLVALLYLWLAGEHGLGPTGLAAVAVLLAMPRFFFHAHLAALDVPAAVAVFATVFVFWRFREQSAAGYDVLAGVVWGLAMATKINAIFVLPTLLLWALLFARCGHLFRRLAVMGLVGTPVFLAAWPWLYDQSLPRLSEYILFVTVDHWEIGQFYLGRFYMPPPWHFSLVMILVTVPLAATLFWLAGVVRVVADPTLHSLGGMLALGALVPLLAPVLGGSLLYDNERLFMPAFPFLAALAGIGLAGSVQALRRGLARFPIGPGATRLATWGISVAAVLSLVPHLVLAGGLYPNLLSYYSEGIGGLPGAARLGLESTYWCETYARALPYLEENAHPGDTVWVEDWSHDVMVYYQLQGRLDPQLRVSWPQTRYSVFQQWGVHGEPVPIQEADFVVIQHRQTGWRPELRAWMQGRRPVYQLAYRGVPLLSIYARDARIGGN